MFFVIWQKENVVMYEYLYLFLHLKKRNSNSKPFSIFHKNTSHYFESEKHSVERLFSVVRVFT